MEDNGTDPRALLSALAGRLNLDAHAHVFGRPTHGAEGSRYVPDYAAPLGRWFEHLRAHGMVGGTLVQPSFLGSDNRQLLQAIEQARALGFSVTGSAVVDPDVDQSTLRDLAGRDIVSVRLNWIGRSLPVNATVLAERMAATAASVGLAVELHMEAQRAPAICNAIVRQGATIILDHFGLARDEGELRRLLDGNDRAGTIFVKASGFYRLPVEPHVQSNLAHRLLAHAVRTIGEDHILWGTDWPHTRHEGHQSFRDAVTFNLSLHEAAVGKSSAPPTTLED